MSTVTAQATYGATYSELIVEALERYADREAFVLGDRRMTYAEAAALTSQIVQVFAACGIRKGSAVAALSPNMPEVWLVQAAAYLLGASYSGLHPLGSVDDHVWLCDDAGVSLLVVHPAFAETGAKVGDRSGAVEYVLGLGTADIGEDLLELAARMSATRLDAGQADHEDVAWLQYTGGTTGRPKGVMLPQRAMAASAQAYASWFCLPERPRYLAAGPITHAAVIPVLPTLMRGGTVVMVQSFDPQEWSRTVQDERISLTLAVPTMLSAVLDYGAPTSHDLSSLETIIYGASPMSPSRIAEALEVFGPVLVQAYGQTESAAVATVLRKDEHDPVGRPELLTSCGRAVPGARVALLGPDDQPVPDGEVGEMCYRYPSVMIGYKNQPELSAQALRNDWLHSGDLGRRDEAGFFHIVDRLKDMVISGGFNVYPREIEDALTNHPSVAAAAVIGVPDEKWGEAVTAFVVPRPGETVDVDALLAEVRERKGPHHTPKLVEVVEQLPMTPVGKVDKKVLRATYWGDQERQVH